MQIGAAWKRWIENLAAVVIGIHEAWRARRALVIACDGEQFVVRHAAAPRGDKGPDTGGPHGDLPITAARAGFGRGHFITLELPAEQTVLQRINVPAQARDFLGGIVRNQIERLSPWPSEQVAYGFDAVASAKDPALLDARILMTSRAHVDSVRGRLAAIGITADRIVARERDAADAAPIILWSRFDKGSGTGRERVGKVVGAAVLGMAVMTVAISAWALVSAAGIRDDGEEIAARSAQLQRQLQPSLALSASLNPAERAWALKGASPSGVMILEVLSQALPDTAYVTELSLQKSTMRIVGLTSDAPSLVSPLEQAGPFAQVHFFAPTTRGPDGMLFWFHIEARIGPINAAPAGRP